MSALLLELHAKRRSAARGNAAQELADLSAVADAIERAQETVGSPLEWERDTAATIVAHADSVDAIEYIPALQLAERAAKLREESLVNKTREIEGLLAEIESRISKCEAEITKTRELHTAAVKNIETTFAAEVSNADSLTRNLATPKKEGPSGCAIAGLIVGIFICVSTIGSCAEGFAMAGAGPKSNVVGVLIFVGVIIIFGIVLCLPFVLRLIKQQREKSAAREAASRAINQSIERQDAAKHTRNLSLQKAKQELEDAEQRLNSRQQQLSEQKSRTQNAMGILTVANEGGRRVLLRLLRKRCAY